MNYPTLPRSRLWDNLWPLLVSLLLGGSVFLFLIFTVGGSLVALLAAIAIVTLSGWLQYAWWGHRMTRSVAGERAVEQAQARLEQKKENFMAEFTLTLNSQERAELLRLLENSLKETRVEVHRTHTPGFRENVQLEEQVLRGLLDKVRYGA